MSIKLYVPLLQRFFSRIFVVVSILFLLTAPAALNPTQSLDRSTVLTLSSSGYNSLTPIREFNLPQNLSYPLGLAVDSQGNLWFGEGNTDTIEEFLAANMSFRSFAIPISRQLAFIWTPVFDSSGNLWFTTSNGSDIWRLDPTTGQFANFSTGNPLIQPYALAYNPSTSELWFTSFASNQFGVFQLSDNGSASLLNVYNLPSQATTPAGLGVAAIALDNHGNVYVTESYVGQIAKFNQSNGLLEHVWSLPKGSEPLGIAIDPLNTLIWFTNHATSDFGYINQTSNAVTQFSTSVFYYKGYPEVTLPYWIYISSTGMIWFDEHVGNRIARFNPSTLQLTEFVVPTNNSEPIKLTLDNQRGLVWFSEFAGNKIGMLEQNDSLSAEIELSRNSLSLRGASTTFNVNVTSNALLPLNVSSTASKTGVLNSNFTITTNTVSSSEERITVARGSSLSPGLYYLTFCTNSTQPVKYCAIASITVDAMDNIYVYVGLGAGAVFASLAISIYFVRRWQSHAH